MKCPYCGEEVKPGTLFCPKCLTEVPWVSEYNTVETLITQKKHEEEKKVCQERKKEQMQKEIRQKKRRLFFSVWICSCFHFRDNSSWSGILQNELLCLSVSGWGKGI